MKSLPRVLVALFAFAFVLAACSSGSDVSWTPAPDDGSDGADTPAETTEPTEPTEPEQPDAPVASAEPEAPVATTAPEAPAEPAEPSGEARVIDLQADSALRFTDSSGQPVPDIPVTPGETVIFRIDNTAGFAHNFWIGTDAELSVPSATTDVGIPDWTTGVEELEWVVPDDLTDLKFGCTVPGHYLMMQGTFSGSAAAPAEPEAPEEPAEPAEPEDPAEPVEPAEAAEPSGEARVIELEADAAIRFLQDGKQIRELEVTPGETVIFRVDNTAGFPHNLYIGSDDDLRVMGGVTDVGIPDWNLGVQELEWVVPEDLTDIRFACTIPGHYNTMQGDFIVAE